MGVNPLDFKASMKGNSSILAAVVLWYMIPDIHNSIILSVFPYAKNFGSRGLVVFNTGHLYQYFYMRLSSAFSHLCK